MDSASSSYKLPQKYDVVINFTGEEIHRKFVSHLNSALSTVGLSTYLHHHNAVKSTHIQEPILNLCQPSDVRLQKGDFGKAFKATAHQTFSEQELEHAMCKWSYALTKAANFFGWDESNYRSDAELVDKIVQGVLNLPVLSATKFPLGLQSHVEDLIRIIKSKSTTVCKIGICGEGGSGKTTLAKAIYHQIQGTFRNKSFIEDIGQVSGIRGDLRVQEQLLLDILKTKVEIPSDDVGRTMIWERLHGKRVLIVVDDVPNYFEILALRNCSRWFSGGSAIIFTARDESLLKHYLLDSVYRIKLMNKNKSLELLSWHLFVFPSSFHHSRQKSFRDCL